MFEYIKGVLEHATTESAVIDIGGIGYILFIPLSTYDGLPETGETVKLFTHFHIREDMQKLYGFVSEAERTVFRQLIGISKIGPKVALNVLSGVSVKDLVYSVQMGDSSKLKAVSGVGAKTAQRLVMELKGKLALDNIKIPERVRKQSANFYSQSLSLKEEAHAALLSLGYNEPQVNNALIRVEQTLETDISVEEWIKKALQVIK